MNKKAYLKSKCKGKGGLGIPSFDPRDNKESTHGIKPDLDKFPVPGQVEPIGPTPKQNPRRDSWYRNGFPKKNPILKISDTKELVTDYKPLKKFQTTIEPVDPKKGMIKDKLNRMTEK